MNLTRPTCIACIGVAFFSFAVGLARGSPAHIKFSTKDAQLAARATCGTDSRFQLTPEAWNGANTDVELASWWKNINTSSNPHGSLVNELSKQFGSGINGFECGIKQVSTCPLPACSDYSNTIWPYMALNAAVHLNTLFNAMFDGITNGQLDYVGLADEISQLFFPAKDPVFALEDVSFWIVAILTIFATVASIIFPASAIPVLGIGAFAGAGVQELTESLKPGVPKSVQLAKITVFATTTGQTARQNLETWANQTFTGELDSSGKNFLDYTAGGSFISPMLPNSNQYEEFYEKQMISRTIGASWASHRYYVTFSRSNDSSIATGPPSARYYSQEDQGVYYVYNYIEDGSLKGHLDAPKNLEKLAGAPYNISGSDIAKASGGAWRQGGFNYTQELASKRIMASITSNGSLRPFRDGAGWEGTWNLPVCDLGNHSDWNSPYGKSGKPNKYDYLPCCCGPDCRDTKAFAKASNMAGMQTYIHGCKEQLNGSDVDFDKVDYGFSYHKINTARNIEIIVGAVVGNFLLIFLLAYCCCR